MLLMMMILLMMMWVWMELVVRDDIWRIKRKSLALKAFQPRVPIVLDLIICSSR